MSIYATTPEIISNFIKDFPGVTNFHIQHVKVTQDGSSWYKRPKMKIILWINEAVFDANNVALKISDEDDFYTTIKKLAAGNFVVEYDIYKK